MKTLIIAINSKYIHSALAPWYLKASCGKDSSAGCGEVIVAEHTINEQVDDIISSIYMQKPDIAAFSCYIWNIATVLRVASVLKKVLPATSIILGGPEVSYDVEDILVEHEFVDYILAGEGEKSFPELITLLDGRKAHCTINAGHGADNTVDKSQTVHSAVNAGHTVDGTSHSDDDSVLRGIKGLAWRSNHGIVSSAPAFIEDLGAIPSPYTDEMLLSLENKIAYFESSRGCPFSCSYCLSSASESTRYFPLERVFAELDRLAASGVKQIKFVDRTFNVNKERAKAIIRHILELNKSGLDCNFHLEVGADLFDEETLFLLENAPKGLFQMEAGIQTVNGKTLDAVCRKTDLRKLFNNLDRLKKQNNVHIHTDLIAGLPNENYGSFIHSFNSVYAIGSHQLQLGFLKFLKGTVLRRSAAEQGFVFQDYPPYEILSGKDISYDELIVLKGVAELVDRFYNSGRFLYSLNYAIEHGFSSPYEFYERFYRFLKENGNMQLRAGLRDLYAIFDRFAAGKIQGQGMDEHHKLVFRELLRLDFLASDRSGTLPDFMEKRADPGFHERCYDFLRSSDQITEMIPEAAGLSAKLLLKKVHFERFTIDPYILIGDVSQKGDTSQKMDTSQKGDTSAQNAATDEDGAVLLFNYMSQDRVTGRYPFYKVLF